MAQQVEIEDVCFLALSRPALMLGVPQIGLLLNLSGSIIVSAWFNLHSWKILLWMAVLAPSIHFVMREGMRRDYHFFTVMMLGSQTKGRGTKYWGGSTLGPLPAWPGRRTLMQFIRRTNKAAQWEQS